MVFAESATMAYGIYGGLAVMLGGLFTLFVKSILAGREKDAETGAKMLAVVEATMQAEIDRRGAEIDRLRKEIDRLKGAN